jgi:hypothetical protein
MSPHLQTNIWIPKAGKNDILTSKGGINAGCEMAAIKEEARANIRVFK